MCVCVCGQRYVYMSTCEKPYNVNLIFIRKRTKSLRFVYVNLGIFPESTLSVHLSLHEKSDCVS